MLDKARPIDSERDGGLACPADIARSHNFQKNSFVEVFVSIVR